MQDTLSYRFIQELGLERDRLYSEALRTGGTPVKAEVLLQKSVRAAYLDYEQAQNRHAVFQVSKEVSKGIGAVDSAPAAEAVTAVAMPADVWARLAAAVQVEAARSSHSAAINPDSVLLSPDPLLAPKKSANDDGDAHDLSPSSKFVVSVGVAVLVGAALTVYIVTRPSAKETGKPTPTNATKSAEPDAPVTPASQPVSTTTAPAGDAK